MTNPTATIVKPEVLGFWVRCVRNAQNMSQDALALSSRLDVRTIQRVEAGQSVNITTRRCVARGLGYENQDIFDDPQFALDIHRLLEEFEKTNEKVLEEQYPEHVSVKVARVQNGETLGRFADASNAVLLNADDEISEEAKNMAAALFDYIRDLMDVGSEASFTEKLSYNKDLENILRDLEELGTAAYSAFRSVKIAGEHWVDKTPIPVNIGYLTVVPEQKVLEQMFVPRRVRML